ncbi:uncharacterized protein E0L32_002291 [Thyridium curvatum]|uniref:Glutathione S-transferase n=1 Tax=Thyridium curvatum TaxID=1093900 RepID=A0A507AD16_9PEZI|nr:uncharacterized protein E0L32_002291 [Thyridium curvatum]TPX06795.1 hypothetical protein E0L32_002291 [Thyridium curvatum]
MVPASSENRLMSICLLASFPVLNLAGPTSRLLWPSWFQCVRSDLNSSNAGLESSILTSGHPGRDATLLTDSPHSISNPASESATAAMTILIHHLHVSQSERIPWLCEELGLPYDLKLYSRAPLLAPPEYKALHPAGSAPTIQDGDLTMAESGAIVTYLCHKHAGGRLFLGPADPEYPHFLYWFHWVNGTFTPALARAMGLASSGQTGPMADMTRARVAGGLAAMDARLRDNEYLGGKEFSAADIMAVFPVTTMRYFYSLDLSPYENILRWLKTVSQREAYQRAMKKCEPDMELCLGAEPPELFAAMRR